MILYSTLDILWASKIKGTAEALGIPARPVRSLEMLEARLAEYAPPNPVSVQALIVELGEGTIAWDLIARVRGYPAGSPAAPCSAPASSSIDLQKQCATDAQRTIRVLAFGPHVLREDLERASLAGATTVMTRGAFAAKMGEVLRELV